MGRLSAKERRSSREVEVDLGDGTTVLCQRVDMPTLVFTGKIPFTMLSAVQSMLSGGAFATQDDGTVKVDVQKALELLGDKRADMVDMMREHAASVALDPKISMDDQPEDLDVMPARLLELPELLAIWNATAFKGGVSSEDAGRFRATASQHDGDAAPLGGDVPPPAVVVDLGPGGKRAKKRQAVRVDGR